MEISGVPSLLQHKTLRMSFGDTAFVGLAYIPLGADSVLLWAAFARSRGERALWMSSLKTMQLDP
jgi:hypothetical protein